MACKARGSDLRVHFKGVWFAWRDRISLGFLVSDQVMEPFSDAPPSQTTPTAQTEPVAQAVVEVQAQAVSQLLLMTNHESRGTHFV
nr:hypothetical protein CFP56_48143 [Quercus suber]